MNRCTLPIILLSFAGCIIQGTPGSGDDEASIPEDPYDQPGWWPASERLEAIGPYPGYVNPPSELEYVPTAPSVLDKPELGQWASLPPKPWVPGISPVFGLSTVGPDVQPNTRNPFYFEVVYDIEDGGHSQHSSVTPSSAMRSGQTGNFGLWIQGVVPSDHPRPPVVWMNILAYIGHPVFAGRYNVFGQWCSTEESIPQNEYWYDPTDSPIYNELLSNPTGPNADCQRGVLYYGTSVVSPGYPWRNHEIARDSAVAAATCLDNGGEYKAFDVTDGVFTGGSVLTATERNGLVWLNWDDIDLNAVLLWLGAETNVIGELGILVDELLSNEFTYWPTDPEYRYARFSRSGICGFAVQLRIAPSATAAWNCKWHTSIGCPSHMVPMLPSFDAEDKYAECEQSDFDAQIDGYCSIPHWELPPGAAFQPNGELDIAPASPDLGLPGSYVVGFGPASMTKLARIAPMIELVEAEAGVTLDAYSPFGERALGEIGLDVDDTITSLGFGHPCPAGVSFRACRDEAGAGSIASPTVKELTEYVETQVGAGDLLVAEVTTPDGFRKRRYMFPSFDIDRRN